MRLKLIVLSFAVTVLFVFSLYKALSPSDGLLVYAAEEGDLQKVKTLLKQGRSINEISHLKFGWTPLIAAIYQNNTNVVHFLIESGADINLPDKRGKTPLMWAMVDGDANLEMVKYLVNHGASLKVKDKDGAAALSYANSAPAKPKILEFLKKAEQEQKK